MTNVTKVRRTKDTIIHYTRTVTFSKHHTPCGLSLRTSDERTTSFVEYVTCKKCAEYLFKKAKKVLAVATMKEK